jgi:3-oxoacyl-[acyl-carrier protein] reductase
MKAALVTGGAKGLGRGFALFLADQGYDVAVAYLNSREDADRTCHEILNKGRRTVAIKADLRDEAQCRDTVQTVVEEFSRIDVLINNVGDFIYKPVSDVSGEELRNVMETNLMSAFYCTQAVLPFMRQQKFGRIIMMGSSGSSTTSARKLTSPYYAAKTGLYILTKALAAEEAKNNITVNMISPGILSTSIVKTGVIPAGRFAEFSDVINALNFLLKEESNYIAGANIDVNGGFVPGYE